MIELDSTQLELLNAPSMEWSPEPAGEAGDLGGFEIRVDPFTLLFAAGAAAFIGLGYITRRAFFCGR